MTLSELESVAEALRRNRMIAHCVEKKEDVLPLLKQLLKPQCSVAVGGSVSLFETGVMDFIKDGEYRFLDRYAPGLTPEEITTVFQQSMVADVYLCSSNAVTRNGELYNVDGRANRVAALAFGPETVIVIVGCNKIVDDLPAAYRRVKTIAAPLNAKRLNCNTYCAQTGACVAVDSACCADGCQSEDRICSAYLVSGWQRVKNRIQVILVGETLGF